MNVSVFHKTPKKQRIDSIPKVYIGTQSMGPEHKVLKKSPIIFFATSMGTYIGAMFYKPDSTDG